MAASTRSTRIGILAEEQNDVDVVYSLAAKVVKVQGFTFSKFLGHGCGKLRNKCTGWAHVLLKKGCTHLIVIHDLDDKEAAELRQELDEKIDAVGFRSTVVLIPVREMEAWLLCDPAAIKSVFSLKSVPKTPANPEYEVDPKQSMATIVRTGGKGRYLNTVHNERIAQAMDLASLKKCPSFAPFVPFIKAAIPKRHHV